MLPGLSNVPFESSTLKDQRSPLARLRHVLAEARDPAKGAALVGLYDGLAPSFLKVTSDLLNHAEVSVLRFIDRSKHSAIAAGSNADDLSSNFNSALGAANGVNLFVPRGLYNAEGLAFASGRSSMRGEGWGARIQSITAGKHILQADGLAKLSVKGLKFQGKGSATVPSTVVGGFAATSTGLVALHNCTDVDVQGCEISDFYNALSLINSTRANAHLNYIHNWLLFGALLSLSDDFTVDRNWFIGCDQAGAANAYGVSATGNEAAGNEQIGGSISWNWFRDIPSWDAIMSHDCGGLTIVGNDIRRVRSGIDITTGTSVILLKHLRIALNYIEATTTNTWGAAAAVHNAILVSADPAGTVARNVQIIGNTIRRFYNMAGATISGNPGHIDVGYSERVSVVGNTIADGGVLPVGPAGVVLHNTVNQATLGDNALDGPFPAGGYRLVNVTGDMMSIGGGTVKQTTSTDPVVYSTGSTIAAFCLDPIASNSTVPLLATTSTLTPSGMSLHAQDVQSAVTVTYSAAMTPDVTKGGEFVITATNATAFQINPPLTPQPGQQMLITLRNASGGALGVATWQSTYKLAAWTNPATGFSRSISFRYDGTNWIEINRTPADVPN
jgi:hypothetical protein